MDHTDTVNRSTAAAEAAAVERDDNPVEQSDVFVLKTSLNIFAFDIGVSSVLGGIAGIVTGIMLIDLDEEAIQGTLITIASVVGLIVSVYAGYVLYSRIQNVRALVYLIIMGLIVTVLSIPSQEYETLATSILMVGSTIVAYFAGWYIGRTNSIKVWMPGPKAMMVFIVIGYISLVLGILGSVAVMLTT